MGQFNRHLPPSPLTPEQTGVGPTEARHRPTGGQARRGGGGGGGGRIVVGAGLYCWFSPSGNDTGCNHMYIIQGAPGDRWS